MSLCVVVVIFNIENSPIKRYHGVTSSFFGIGILPVSDLTGQSVFQSVLLIWRELLFSAKGGLAVSKRGPVPPFSSKRGPGPHFEGKKCSRQKMIPKCTDRDFLRYRYGKYRKNTDRYRPKNTNSISNSSFERGCVLRTDLRIDTCWPQ